MNINAEKPEPLLWISDLLTLLAIALFLFSIYIAPHVLFDKTYPLPGFLFDFAQWLQENTAFSQGWQKVIFFLPFLVPSLIFFYFSKLITDYLEAKESEKALRQARQQTQSPTPEIELSDAGDIKPERRENR